MRIREYTPADLDALRRLHAAQGFGYAFPDLDSPLFVTKLVLEDDGDDTSCETASGQGREAAGGREVARGSSAGDKSQTGHASRMARSTPARDDSPPQPSVAEALSPSPRTEGNSPRIEMAVLLRLMAEAYLLHDPFAGTPRERWHHILALHEAAQQSAAARGLDDVQAFLPPRIARAFGRRLARLGWRHDPWPCFSRRLT